MILIIHIHTCSYVVVYELIVVPVYVVFIDTADGPTGGSTRRTTARGGARGASVWRSTKSYVL